MDSYNVEKEKQQPPSIKSEKLEEGEVHQGIGTFPDDGFSP